MTVNLWNVSFSSGCEGIQEGDGARRQDWQGRQGWQGQVEKKRLEKSEARTEGKQKTRKEKDTLWSIHFDMFWPSLLAGAMLNKWISLDSVTLVLFKQPNFC